MELLTQAQWSLHVVIRDASVIIRDPSFNLMDFLNSFPAQVRNFIFSANFIWFFSREPDTQSKPYFVKRRS